MVAAFDEFTVNPAGLGADDFGDDEQFTVGFEDAPGDEHFGAGQLADFGGGILADVAGQAEFVFAEDFLEFGPLDGDDLRFGGKVGVDEGGHLGTEIADGFVSGLEIKDGDGKNVSGAGGDGHRQQQAD